MTAMGPANLNAFYLFSDDLTQSQLVGSSWEACLRNLQSTPILFEGTEILNASDKLLNPDSRQHRTFLANPAETGLPLIQTLCAQPASAEFGQGLNNSVGMGTVMDLDA
ncbi:hypothetical protein ARAM_003295 [Aspergillus rambellii]|uniref:Uncharacterized protein n=3 Tax=Aspergillus subgen. Nidulantes TaxID=2720870 RepID=A0A0F8VP61_9EURO|nr:hypothetical protein ARAM_003295 [Aspergillus rambellii]